ncbi:Hsp70 family protein [Hoyosella rhizosphaerae]|nr:Hsp70 family protein [Hoyosella rhizosphaerae]MBN4925539.1 Hsp70 family protein [Hoyosella rhizosphaerae]
MAAPWVLGIDFGTSNTAAAHNRVTGGGVEALPLSHHGNLLPSAVFMKSPTQIEVGEVAINQAELNPAAFLAAPKRVLGQRTISLDGYDLPPSDVVAAVIAKVVAKATTVHGGAPPSTVVLTHPEAWSVAEIQALTTAAMRAGVPAQAIRTISEPRAAVHYYTRTNTLREGESIAVFDFGGGTLDVAVLSACADGGFDVVAARGDNALGGKTFDALVRRWVDEQLNERNPELFRHLRETAPLGVLRTVDDSIRRAKELLSETPSARITVSAAGKQENLLITRDEFEELIGTNVERAVDLTRATLRSAGVDANRLSALYLTGGSSRTPLVHHQLGQIGPIATLDDPKTVVAQGAIIAFESGNTTTAPPEVLTTTPASFASAATDLSRPHSGADTVFTGPPIPTAPGVNWTETYPVTATTPTGVAAGTGRYTTGNTEPDAPNQTAGETTTHRTGRVTAIAGGVLAVLVGAALIVPGLFPSTDDPDRMNTGDTTTAQAAAENTMASNDDAATGADIDTDTVDGIMSVMPASLAQDLTCERSSFSGTNNKLTVRCTINEGSELLHGINRDQFLALHAYIDRDEADTLIRRWQEYDDEFLVENSDYTVGVLLKDEPSTSMSDYANRDSGLILRIFNMDLVDVEQFVRNAGLL